MRCIKIPNLRHRWFPIVLAIGALIATFIRMYYFSGMRDSSNAILLRKDELNTGNDNIDISVNIPQVKDQKNPDGASVYLRLINSFNSALSAGNVSATKKRKIEDLIRNGSNLEPYTTELGEAGWLENGIVYRPWRKEPVSETMNKKYPSPYSTEYEAYVPFNENTFFEGRTPDPSYKKNKKIILWQAPPAYIQPLPGLLSLRSCPDFPCQITTNKKNTKDSAALIITAQSAKGNLPQRTDNQVFVLHNQEATYETDVWNRLAIVEPAWKDAFNWTMTFRPDSDFFAPYGIVRKRPKPLENKNYTDIAHKKKKMAAWIVSSCNAHSDRIPYVKELQKYMKIDIYGACGTFKCERKDDHQCADKIATDYKFYLSFENSFCVDYITEKLFHYLTMDTIVVARGTNQYFQHAPSEIFLNTADFPSPKALAERMIYLDNHDDAYTAMLKEKDKYMSILEDYPMRNSNGQIIYMYYRFEAVPICLMCQRLWNLDKYSKSIPDIQEWYNQRYCYKNTDLK